MHISTSTHILSLADDHIYNLRKIGVAGDDSWLESRRGEAFDRHLQVKLKDNELVLYFEDKNIGTIGPNNHAQVQYLISFVEYWNRVIGPTDLATTRTIQLVKDWPQLIMKKLLKFKCVTWNCAGLLADTALKSETWTKLLGSENESDDDDVIVIGFQESDNLNRSVKANTATLQSCIEVSRAYLHRTHTLISTIQLLGLMTLVFVRNSLAPYVSNVTTDTSSTGFLRMWGNKGAVLTRFTLYRDETIGGGIEVSIVNCHLSAGEGIAQLGRRRWELREIGSKFLIPGLTGANGEVSDYDRDPDETDSISSISSSDNDNPDFDYVNPPLPTAETGALTSSSSSTDQGTLRESITSSDTVHRTPSNDPDAVEKNLARLHMNSENAGSEDTLVSEEQFSTRPSKYTILLGDLNYRILLSRNDAYKKIKKEEWEGLLAHDSLSIERRQGIVFSGFEEPALHFAPTYKYEIGTSKLASRVPSYTDRVMYRSACRTHVRSYRSVPELKFSDHRPVIFQGSVEALNCTNPIKATETINRAMKLADDAENNARPRLEVEDQQITLSGPPLTLQQHKIVIKNEGSRPIKWIIEDAHAHVNAIEEQERAEAEQKAAGSTAPGQTQGSLTSNDPGSTPTSNPVNNNLGTGKSPLPSLHEYNSDLNNLYRGRHSNAQPLVTNDDLTITPGQGTLSTFHPTATLKVIAKTGIEPRDFIALITTQGQQEASLQKYVFIKIVPTKSYLGQPVERMPLHKQDNIPFPIYRCVEYLDSLPELEKLSRTLFLTKADPSLFHMVLKWLDNDREFDPEVLESANDTGNYAGAFAVAQVLLAVLRYSPSQFIGPNMKKRSPLENNLIKYICNFILKLNPDDNTLDLWANTLYDQKDKKAGKSEKRAFLRSMLIIAEAQE